MDRSVYDRITEIFPKNEYSVTWMREESAPEFPSPINCPELLKRTIAVQHLDSNHEAMLAKLEAFKAEGHNSDRVFSFFLDEPRLDFDPSLNTEALVAVIYYNP